MEHRPEAGTEVLTCTNDRTLDPRECERNRDDREREISGHHPENDREIGEQQPLTGGLHNSKTHERTVDDALSAKHEAPCKSAHEAAREERNGEQCEQKRSAPRPAQQADNRRRRHSEERGRCGREHGEAGCAKKDGCASVLEQGRIGCERPGGLDPVGVGIETPEAPRRHQCQRMTPRPTRTVSDGSASRKVVSRKRLPTLSWSPLGQALRCNERSFETSTAASASVDPRDEVSRHRPCICFVRSGSALPVGNSG